MILSCIYVHKACVDQILTVWLSEDVNLLLRFFVKLLYPVRERKYIPNPWGSVVINLRRLDHSFNGETCRHRPSIMLLQTPIFLPLPCLKKKKKKEIGVDVCDGRDPFEETKWGILFSFQGCCKFTWPLNSPLHKPLSLVQQLLFKRIRRHCCLGHSSGMLSSGVYVRWPL